MIVSVGSLALAPPLMRVLAVPEPSLQRDQWWWRSHLLPLSPKLMDSPLIRFPWNLLRVLYHVFSLQMIGVFQRFSSASSISVRSAKIIICALFLSSTNLKLFISMWCSSRIEGWSSLGRISITVAVPGISNTTSFRIYRRLPSFRRGTSFYFSGFS